MGKNFSLKTNKVRTKIHFSAKETIEIKLTEQECKALKECFKDLKEIQPVVIDFEEKELNEKSLF